MQNDLSIITGDACRSILIPAVEKGLLRFAAFPVLRHWLELIPDKHQLHLLAIGKSAFLMAQVATEVLSQRQISFDGYLLTKYKHLPLPIPGLCCLEAGHPIPDANSFRHSATIITWLESLATNEHLLILLSGGGSSLFEMPASGFSPEDIISLNKRILLGGEDIASMNRQRSTMSAVKNGRALAHIACHDIIVLALSDVFGNHPSVIASGPFTPVGNTDRKVDYHIIGDNLSLLKTILEQLPQPNYLHSEFLHGKVEETSELLYHMAVSDLPRGLHLFGGESPVTAIPGGRGGRCTHLALDFAMRISGISNISLLTCASDGNDNVEGVSGAFVDGSTAARIRGLGINPLTSLHSCNSLPALQAVNAIVPTLASSINVNDIYLLIKH